MIILKNLFKELIFNNWLSVMLLINVSSDIMKLELQRCHIFLSDFLGIRTPSILKGCNLISL